MTAPDKLVVEVTADDIENGIPCNLKWCAVALAISRLPGVTFAASSFETLRIAFYRSDDVFDGSDQVIYELPHEAIAFIERFDRADHVEPFTFTATIKGEQ